MNETLPWVLLAVIVAALLWALGTALMDGYFKRKKRLIDDIVNRQKGITNAKD